MQQSNHETMKKLLVIFLFAIFFIPSLVLAEENLNLYFFYGQGCPHCAKEEIFLEKIEKEYDNIQIYRYETWYNGTNARLLAKVGKELGIKTAGVPILIIGGDVILGYHNDETTGQKIIDKIDKFSENGCSDPVAPILGLVPEENKCIHGCDLSDDECAHDCGCTADVTRESSSRINVPFIGEVDAKNVSLPILTILIGGLDGFNPCAMWVLLFLISLLLGMEDRKKMWILGGAFIFSSGLVYFLFLAAWLNLFLFIGFIFWIRFIIALVAVGSGSYHLREYFKNKKGTCHVTEDEDRRKTFYKLKEIISRKNFLFALGGIVLLAAAVNLVELVCSAGFPAIYTQILSLAHLPTWQYYGYLLLYIFVFMLDDLLIFVLAMVTLKMQGISSKYTRYSNLIGGILMLIIGLLLLFKPGWLMFG